MTNQDKINRAVLDVLLNLRAAIAASEPKYVSDRSVVVQRTDDAIEEARRLMGMNDDGQ